MDELPFDPVHDFLALIFLTTIAIVLALIYTYKRKKNGSQ